MDDLTYLDWLGLGEETSRVRSTPTKRGRRWQRRSEASYDGMVARRSPGGQSDRVEVGQSRSHGDGTRQRYRGSDGAPSTRTHYSYSTTPQNTTDSQYKSQGARPRTRYGGSNRSQSASTGYSSYSSATCESFERRDDCRLPLDRSSKNHNRRGVTNYPVSGDLRSRDEARVRGQGGYRGSYSQPRGSTRRGRGRGVFYESARSPSASTRYSHVSTPQNTTDSHYKSQGVRPRSRYGGGNRAHSASTGYSSYSSVTLESYEGQDGCDLPLDRSSKNYNRRGVSNYAVSADGCPRGGKGGRRDSYRESHESSRRGRDGFSEIAKYRTGYMEHKQLEELFNSDMDERKLVLTLIAKTTGFEKFLNCDSIDSDMVRLTLALISKACQSTGRQNVIELLTQIVHSQFLEFHVAVTYLIPMKHDTNVMPREVCCESIGHILDMLHAILSTLPSFSNKCETILFILQKLPQWLGLQEETVSPLYDRMKELQGQVQEIQRTRMGVDSMRRTRRTSASNVNMNPCESLAPPNDFRELSISPESRDIHTEEKPYLRSNKDVGGYADLDHYLDVQFRLIREDYISPLRDGISEYLGNVQHGKPHSKLQDMRLYEGVQIKCPRCTRDGIAYRLQFDTTRLRGIRWQASKRLLYGSLVCLSSDNFQTMVFATVIEREVKDLVHGFVDVRFIDTAFVPDEADHTLYLMAETTAFFEAYRHVLSGLQGVEVLPFQRYIVACEHEVNPPRYLQRKAPPIYDLTCFLKCEASKKEKDQAKAVRVLTTYRWPSKHAFCFDDSQLDAVKTALTKEFTIIQGPPGTGKTFVGLKIVQALLDNKVHQSFAGPILVVCYTNHALDQFLEGMLEFLDQGLVRIGGRCENENLQKFVIRNIKANMKRKKKVRRDIRDGTRNCWREMMTIKEEIEETAAQLETSASGILHEKVLAECMTDEQWVSFHRISEQDFSSGRRLPAMISWLNLGADKCGHLEGGLNHGQVNDAIATDTVDNDEKGEGEEDIFIDAEEEADVITAHRLIDDEEEFDDFDNSKLLNRQRMNTLASEQLAVSLEREQTHVESTEEGWRVQMPSKSKSRQRIKQILRGTEVMSGDTARSITDIWSLHHKDRQRLYRHWLTVYRRKLKDIIREKNQRYEAVTSRFKEVKDLEDRGIMKDAAVIGMTTTGAARLRHILQYVQPRIIVVEEAAEVLESHIIASLNARCEHLILIGDHKQLRPSPAVYKLAKHFKLELSLFERMVNNNVHCDTLQLQHRMRPEIAELMQYIYPELQNHESVLSFEDVKGVSSNIFFVDHTKPEVKHEESKSRSNAHEARFISALCRYLILQGYETTQITVLTTYSGQVFSLKKQMPRSFFQGVRVTAVDNYQGEESDIILLSLVRSNTEGSIGFLNVENRVCVALSRARKGLFVIGNFDLLANQSQLWSNISTMLKTKQRLGPAIGLYCQNHPDIARFTASTEEDFDAAPEGGCMRPCEARLECGHLCTKRCHILDSDHSKYKCHEPCVKTCEIGHKCPKHCCQPCGLCRVRVQKVIPICLHQQMVPCHQDEELFKCQGECTYVLPCGHKCAAKCSDDHTTRCKTSVSRSWPCGHVVETDCYKKPESYPCPTPCGALLDCLHSCPGTCGSCHQGKLHIPCEQRCRRTLICGHECSQPCTTTCPPCGRKCENRCVHMRCRTKTCGDLCVACSEPCEWRCDHHRCTKLCGELCDRPPCDDPCTKTLPCGHPCIGLCGEVCPELCRICHKQTNLDIFSGTEDKDDSRFIVLEDCGHIVEVGEMDCLMSMSDEDKTVAIELKACPKCKTIIRKSSRYGNAVKTTLCNIDLAKEKILGDRQKFETEAQNVLMGVTEDERLVVVKESGPPSRKLVSMLLRSSLRH